MTATQRCANCGARLAPADQWCSLCHAPISDSETQPMLAPQSKKPDPPAPVPPRPDQLAPDPDEVVAELAAHRSAGPAAAELFQQKPVKWGIMVLGPLLIIGLFFLAAAIAT